MLENIFGLDREDFIARSGDFRPSNFLEMGGDFRRGRSIGPQVLVQSGLFPRIPEFLHLSRRRTRLGKGLGHQLRLSRHRPGAHAAI